jgi:DNA-binding transcriptional regulator GbsR (MarR family)
MTEDEAEFVEAMAALLGSYGLPPMAGRMWGYLLICDPPEQTAAQVSEALHASRGAISGTARLLTSAGFIRRGTKRGDRREYFSAPPEAFDSMLMDSARVYALFRRTIEQGLSAIADRPRSTQERLRSLHAAFSFVEREVPALVQRYIQDRDGQTNQPTPALATKRRKEPNKA